MGLVSVCIALLLAVPVLAGTEMVYDKDWYEPDTVHQLRRSMAMTRLNRCSTIAGALDTYAKGLLSGNGIAMASVSPTDRQAEILSNLSEQTPPYQLPLDPS